MIIRPLHRDELRDLFTLDGRGFGVHYDDDAIAERMPILETERFRVAVDGGDLVGATGAYSFEMTMPGGSSVPTAGVTWVSVLPTHRRRGILSKLVDASFAEAGEHGDPLCALTASEGGIYGRFGYGVASHVRVTSIDRRAAALRDDIGRNGPVRYVDSAEMLKRAPDIWDRARVHTPGEVSRSEGWWQFLNALRGKAMGEMSATFYLFHDDGYAAYRISENWQNGRPAHKLTISELVAATDDALGALWRTLLAVDLVGTIESRVIAVDDPLPLWLTNPRIVRTIDLNDNLWLRVLDVPAVLEARTYGTDDELVVDVVDERWPAAAGRYCVAGSPTGATCRRDRHKADLVLPADALGAIVLGAVKPSWLVRANRAEARDERVARRADAFFSSERAPNLQTLF